MGTTAEKFDYLRETKKQIRAQLILKGGGITKSTPFRQYASAIASLNVDQPKLNAGAVSESDGVISFANPSTNGNFCTRWAVYADGTYLADAAIGNSINLYDLIDIDGDYSITAKSLGQYFEASASSIAITVTLTGSGLGYKLTANSYGHTVTFLTTYTSSSNNYGTTITIDQKED